MKLNVRELEMAVRGEEQYPMDKYIYFLLACGLSKTKIGELTGLSRQSIYNTIERHPELAGYEGIDDEEN